MSDFGTEYVSLRHTQAGRAASSAAISVQAGVLWFLDKYN